MIHGGAPSQGGAFPSRSSFFDLDKSDLREDQRGPGPSLSLSLGLHHSQLSLSPLWRQVGHPGAGTALLVALHSLSLFTFPQTLNQCLSEVLAHRRSSGNANGVDGQTSTSLCAATLSPSHHLLCPTTFPSSAFPWPHPSPPIFPFTPVFPPKPLGPPFPLGGTEAHFGKSHPSGATRVTCEGVAEKRVLQAPDMDTRPAPQSRKCKITPDTCPHNTSLGCSSICTYTIRESHATHATTYKHKHRHTITESLH